MRVRSLIVVTLVVVLSGATSGQALGVLHVKVTLTDAARALMPIPRHAFLISDNPNTRAPRRIVTAPDGTAEVRLPPGNYTVESDEPVTFNGKSYQWAQTLDITAGSDVVLELTAGNAEIGAASSPASAAAPAEHTLSLLLPQWRDSVVAVWTGKSRASGFLVAAAGLIVTSQRVEVTPIHPFTLELRVSETDAIREGLYVFDPQALGPHCKAVRLLLYSEKAPGKPDTRAVDPQLIERIWQDFAPYRMSRRAT